MNVSNIQQRPAPLPADVTGLTKKLQEKKSVKKDNVMALLTELYADDPAFQTLLEATEDDDAIHGSYLFDRFVASQKIKERARAKNNPYITPLSEAAISKLLESCMNTLGYGRKQRRHGEMVSRDDEAVAAE